MSKVEVSTATFGPRFSETVLAELDERFSRRKITLAASSDDLPFGLALTKGADGKYAPLTETDGVLAGKASAILIEPVAASASDCQAVVLGGYCIVNASALVWDKSVTTQKTVAIEELEAVGIIVREE